MARKLTQADRVLAALRFRHDSPHYPLGWICGVEFVTGQWQQVGGPAVLRYSAVIHTLRDQGHPIEGERCPEHKTHRYRLTPAGSQGAML